MKKVTGKSSVFLYLCHGKYVPLNFRIWISFSVVSGYEVHPRFEGLGERKWGSKI